MKLVIAFFLLALACRATDDAAWRKIFGECVELQSLGAYMKAKDAAQLAISEAEKFGPTDARVGITLNEAGSISHKLGQGWESERTLLKAIRILEMHPDQVNNLAAALSNLVITYITFGKRYAEAEILVQRSLRLAISQLGPRHQDVAKVYNNLAALQAGRGDRIAARLNYEKALELSVDDDVKAGILGNLGAICFEQNDFPQALEYLKESISRAESKLGPTHPILSVPLYNLGRTYMSTQNLQLAEAALLRALEISEKRIGPSDVNLPKLLFSLAFLRRQVGDKKQAKIFENRAKEVQASSLDAAVSRSQVHVSEFTKPPRK
jgi:tetratricopeptide (TPR) repeat protein